MRIVARPPSLVLALAGCGSDDGEDTAAPQPGDRDGDRHRDRDADAAARGARTSTCSTTGVRLTLPEQDLPAEVAEVRQRVFDAAVACDYGTLEQIALEQGEGFTFSYGGGDSAAEYWRERRGEPAPNGRSRCARSRRS